MIAALSFVMLTYNAKSLIEFATIQRGISIFLKRVATNAKQH